MRPDNPSTAARAAVARPTLIPGLRLLWRSRRRLQLGVDPARAVVLELPEPGTARLLGLLDGTRSERTVIAHARRYGIAEPDARTMIDSLHAAGLVVSAQALLPHQFPDAVRQRLASEAAALCLRRTRGTATAAQILRRRAVARVAVTGGGPLVGPVAVGLARAGVGHVAPMLDRTVEAEDAAAAIARQVPGVRTAALRRRDVTFAVRLGEAGPAAVAAAGYAGRRLPHLVVTVRDAAVVVGPLVPPAGSPCLNCLDLHRQDRDPEWPTVAAQLATPAPHPAPCSTATALIATGLAIGEVLSWIDGARPTTVGASVEVGGWGRIRQRSWPPHPACHCLRRSRRGTMTR